MTIRADSLAQRVRSAFEQREGPLRDLGEQALALALASREMAERFQRGGRLLVFGNGSGATDSQHVAVEFVHPVIVGKRALPALSLASDVATLMGIGDRLGLARVYSHQVEVFGRPDDIALGVSKDGRCANVRAALRAARARGLLTVALVGGDGGDVLAEAEADHTLVVRSADAHTVKEGHVTAYHVLWELVHVFLDAPQAEHPSPSEGVEGLYPFLYGRAGAGTPVLESAADSARQKVAEIIQLRRQVGSEMEEALAVCAEAMARSFAAGGTLLAFGNGGSSTDAQDVVHTFLDPPPTAGPLPALCLTNDVAVLTALSNDVSFEVVFSRQVSAFGRPGDIAFALSTSGGSKNVLAAIEQAERAGMITIGLAGYGGGQMAEMSALHHLFAIPSSSVHRVQEVQTTIYHVLWAATRAALGAEPD